MFNPILFDLDGTLTDPGTGITNSFAYALKKLGVSVPDRRELYKFIGPPLQGSFEKYYGFSADRATKAVQLYREYFSVKGLYENKVYPGIPEMLQKLKVSGRTLILATSKPTVYALEILRHFSLDGYMDYVAGSNLDGSRVKKSEVIAHAFAGAGISDRSRAVMVGDRKHDILGAKEEGIPSVGVLFGYGNQEELEKAGADYIARDVAALSALLLAD